MEGRVTAAPPPRSRAIAASDPPSATQAASRNTPGPLWAALGCYWVPLWAPPGHPWVLLGSSWATLGVHWRSSVTPGCSLAPPGRSWAVIGSPFTCWIHFGSHFSSDFLYFSEPLKTWILQYLTAFLNVLAIPKALILGHLFDHFFYPILGPLWKSLLAHLGRQRCRPCLPMSMLNPFLGPPLDPKWDLGATRGALGCS